MGDGNVDVAEWLADLGRLCRIEHKNCVDMTDSILHGNACRVYRRMMVSEGSQWDAVKATLLAEFAIRRQEAWRRFTARKFEEGEAVDLYVDDLELLGFRLEVSSDSLVFRTKFCESLPAHDYEWEVLRECAHTAGFHEVVAALRARMGARRAADGWDRPTFFAEKQYFTVK